MPSILLWSAFFPPTTSAIPVLKSTCSLTRLLVILHVMLCRQGFPYWSSDSVHLVTGLLMSHTLFCTNCFHSRSPPRIQCSTPSESYQHLIWQTDLIWEINRAKISGESNWSRGIVCSTSGKTLVFEITIFRYVSSTVSILKYTTAAYALTDASQKPLRLVDNTCPITPKEKHRGTLIGSPPSDSLSKLFQILHDVLSSTCNSHWGDETDRVINVIW